MKKFLNYNYYNHEEEIKSQGQTLSDIDKLSKIEYIEFKDFIVWMRISYRLKDGKGILTMKPMGKIDNLEKQNIQSLTLKEDDKIMSIYSGTKEDVIKFMKFSSLRSKVESLGTDVYQPQFDYEEFTFSALENIVSLRACFKKEFEIGEYDELKKSKILYF